MEIVEPGHVYDLQWLDGEPVNHENRLVFVNREEEAEHAGTQTQEVLRALIDRTMHCDNCLRWPGNDAIIFHLRMALALHEARHLLRLVEKGYAVERIRVGEDGHFYLAWAISGDDANAYDQTLRDEESRVEE